MKNIDIIKFCDQGPQVQDLQRWLIKHGYFTDKYGRDLPIDGRFGTRTKLAVLAAQNEGSIKEDGIVGPNTQQVMRTRDNSWDRNVNPKYRNERGTPGLPLSSMVSLVFDGRNLSLRGPGKYAHYPAVSGRPVQNNFDYSRSSQQNQDTGPIPEGTYWIQVSELWRNRWWSPRKRSSWGNYALSIHPFGSTITYGRGGFFIHGGYLPGSKGCIDLTHNMDRFVADLMVAVGETPECSIPLRVKYAITQP